MKKMLSLLILAVLATGFMTGCASSTLGDSQVIQSVLNDVLPPGFEGDLVGNHDGFYFGTSVHLNVDLHGLKKDASGQWTWRSGGYKRDGFFSTGGITLTPNKP